LNDYVVLKLISGEQLFARLLNETDEGVVILNPIHIKMIPIMQNGDLVEKAVLSSFGQFTEDKQFVLDRKNVIFCKDLHHKMIPFYRRSVKQLVMIEERTEMIETDPEPEEEVQKVSYH
jgi:hypothetical protein